VLVEPLVARVPLQAPLAVQLVALVLDQVSVEAPPLATDAGDAEMATVGAGTTVTVADWVALPPGPVQVSEKVDVAATAPVTLPLVGCAPLQAPPAVQAVALVVVHDNVELPPAAMLAGVAVRTTDGGGLPVASGRISMAFTYALPLTRVKTRLSVPSDVTVKVRSLVVLAGNDTFESTVWPSAWTLKTRDPQKKVQESRNFSVTSSGPAVTGMA
jgi:hypothetical protein